MATQWRVFADSDALVRALADALCAEAAAAIAARGAFHLVLAEIGRASCRERV